MNVKHARDVLAALAACDPAGAYAGTQEAIAAVAGGDPGARWELSFRAGDSPAVKADVAAAAGGRGRKFAPKAFEEPVASALAAFHALCPVASVARSGERWTLVLERPVPWPAFLRCDVSAGFAARGAQLALVLRDARVAALDFDGEALWARCVG